MKYNSGPYNQVVGDIQRIRVTDGCPNQCEFCYCPPDLIYHGVPEIVKERVELLDMNILAHPEGKNILIQIGNECKEIDLVCGIDFRFMTNENAYLLKTVGVKKIRFAWDGKIGLQYKMKETVLKLRKVGFKDISVFVIANWKIPLHDCLFKLDLLKIWNCKVCDSYFDGQVSPRVKPVYWSIEEIKYFRKKCRKHNQMVLFGVDPQPKFRIPFKLQKGQRSLF